MNNKFIAWRTRQKNLNGEIEDHDDGEVEPRGQEYPDDERHQKFGRYYGGTVPIFGKEVGKPSGKRRRGSTKRSRRTCGTNLLEDHEDFERLAEKFHGKNAVNVHEKRVEPIWKEFCLKILWI